MTSEQPAVNRTMANAFGRAGRYLAGACVLAFAALGILGVVARTFPFLSIHVAWIDELTRLILVWMVFLGCSLVSAKDAHFRIGIFVDPLPDRLRIWVRAAADLLVAGFLVLLLHQSSILAWSQTKQRTSVLEFPVALFPLAIAIGSAAMLFFTARAAVRRHMHAQTGPGSETVGPWTS